VILDGQLNDELIFENFHQDDDDNALDTLADIDILKSRRYRVTVYNELSSELTFENVHQDDDNNVLDTLADSMDAVLKTCGGAPGGNSQKSACYSIYRIT